MSQQAQQNRTFTREDVAAHNKDGDAWIIVRGSVYDVSKFASVHPAGKKILLQYAGRDASEDFLYFHDAKLLHGEKYSRLKIGTLKDDGAPQKAPLLAVMPNAFGDLTPFAEHPSAHGWHSPYFNESHYRLRAAVRAFVEREIAPFALEWEENGAIPPELFKKCAAEGLFALTGTDKWPSEYYPGGKLFGVALEHVDGFHRAIIADEFNAVGTSATIAALTTGVAVGLPPILRHGSQYVRDKCVAQIMRGEKIISLAITEPWAGSDVAQLRTTAVKSACGKFYIVNGMKKWITNGLYSDFYTTAVRTDPDGGMFGISLLLIEYGTPGFSRRKMQCQGLRSSGTSFLVFENVKVPVENLIGKENDGFKYVMINFNSERLGIVIGCARLCRTLVSEAFKHAHRRRTFGKLLIDHPVIRAKLANMIRETEAAQSLIDQLIYNYAEMERAQSVVQLSPVIALAKAQVTQAMHLCAREASQIFGGLSYTRSGLGARVESLYREVKGFAVPGGSEEIMLDLGARMASRLMPAL